MIKFTNVERQSELELAILGYEAPENPHCNWLMVKVLVSQKDKTFESVSGALEATEIPFLIEWLGDLSQLRLPDFARIGFTEPNIEFEFLSWRNGIVSISAFLSHEFQPPFKSRKSQRDEDQWRISSGFTAQELSAIISNLKSVMEQYPVREVSQKRVDWMRHRAERQALYRKMVELNPDDVERLISEGELKARCAIGQQMRKDGVPTEDICRYTGLTFDELLFL